MNQSVFFWVGKTWLTSPSRCEHDEGLTHEDCRNVEKRLEEVPRIHDDDGVLGVNAAAFFGDGDILWGVGCVKESSKGFFEESHEKSRVFQHPV